MRIDDLFTRRTLFDRHMRPTDIITIPSVHIPNYNTVTILLNNVTICNKLSIFDR